jgi:carboxyl-terminal processing protease
VLDLRYNGGGLVSVARDLASLVGGSRSAGCNYTTLLYNATRAGENNTAYSFNDPPQALGLQRVYILAGERTCSASEQLANGLRPFVNVVLVGDTTCGKPVGFLPHDDRCGNVYNVVNFETVNANNEGRYFDGLGPTCAVSEDWSKPLGSIAEPLLATALRHADGGSCTAPATARQRALAAAGGPRIDEGERRSMIADR